MDDPLSLSSSIIHHPGSRIMASSTSLGALSSPDDSTNDTTEGSLRDAERSKASSPALSGNGLKMRIKRNGKMKAGSTSSSSSSANNSRAASPSSSTNSRMMEGDGQSDLVHDFILAATGARKDAENPLKNLILKQQASLKENGISHSENGENSSPAPIFEDERSNEASTMTEPDKLGPCEPGTAVRLQGIVWQETEKGLLVLNVTWKGKTYMGTLLDCNRQSEAHKWGPLSDPSAIKGRGGKRNRTARSRTPPGTSGSSSKLHKKHGSKVNTAPKTPEPPPPPLHSKVKRKAAINALCGLKKKDPEEEEDEESGDDFDDDENDLRDCLIECPKSNCSKKFRDLEALKFHLSFAHNDLKRPKKKIPSEPKEVEDVVPEKEENEEADMDQEDDQEEEEERMMEGMMVEEEQEGAQNGVENSTIHHAQFNETSNKNKENGVARDKGTTLPQEARLMPSSTSSNKDSCESNVYSDISDEEPDAASTSGRHPPPANPSGTPEGNCSSSNNNNNMNNNSGRCPTSSQQQQQQQNPSHRNHVAAPSVMQQQQQQPSSLPTSINSNIVSSNPPPLNCSPGNEQRPPGLPTSSSSNLPPHHPFSNQLPKAGPPPGSTGGLLATPGFSPQAFRHFAMFGSSHQHHGPGSPQQQIHHGTSRKIPPPLPPGGPTQKQQHDLLRSFPHHHHVHHSPFSNAPPHPNPFLAASKLQELQEKAFSSSSSLHPVVELPPNPPSHFPLPGVDHGGKPGPPFKRPIHHHNLFPPALRHEHKHTHLHLPGISPLPAKNNDPMDTSPPPGSHFSPATAGNSGK